MKDDSLGSEYLHPHFWYHGMNKIKAGKGYRNDKPLGPIGGKCSECDGDIISIKMNTSAKGFETTSEKVCNKCGLIVPGAFQTIEPQPQPNKQPNLPYTLIDIHETHQAKQQTFIKLIYGYYDTHEQWVERYCHEDDDIAWDAEAFAHATGKRLNTGDDVDYGPHDEVRFANRFDRNKRLELAIWRLARTPASIKMNKQLWRVKQYHETADDYIHMLELLPYQAEDVHYAIDKYGVTQLTRYGKANADDVIYHYCLIFGNKDLRKYPSYNKNLYDLLTERLGR